MAGGSNTTSTEVQDVALTESRASKETDYQAAGHTVEQRGFRKAHPLGGRNHETQCQPVQGGSLQFAVTCKADSELTLQQMYRSIQLLLVKPQLPKDCIELSLFLASCLLPSGLVAAGIFYRKRSMYSSMS